MQDRITTALEASLAAGGIPGAVALVGNRSGTIAEVAVGTRGPGGPALTTDSLFQIASMTKAVTSVAVMQLVEQGRLALDEDIGTLLPGLADPLVLTGFGADGSAITRSAAGPVTLRQLLTHTSGLGYEFMSAELSQWRTLNPAAQGSRASLLLPLLADPGTAWIYGISTDWAGLAVEAASGMPLGDWFARHIFGPLGMTDTGFGFDEAVKARLAPLHVRTPDGGLVPMPVHFGGGDAAEFQSGGGGLTGSAHDYLRFVRMLLNGGSLDGARILKAQTVADMTRNHIGPLRAGVMETNVPGFAGRIEWFPEMTPGWGLGFMINPDPGPDGRAPGAQAWAGIANSYYWFDPASDIAAVLMMQHLPFGEAPAMAVLSAFEAAVYGP
ncbi:serine hydrolase domain-containing protein [Sandarakinorhabdus sp.]|uniref:serine hydrolase domain-containing protein n=1 Tax=Sandarakinorhabdus sp. TaxID=1916663 RepID=UPI00286D6B12|nr:serine hydrolase domain-containing protein [Sandarakinorhabdus sp.]